jgi:hypothetical protein
MKNRERSLQTIEFRDFKLHVIFSMQKRALIRRRGASDSFSVEAGLSTLSTASVMLSHLVHRPLLQTTSIFFLCDVSLNFPFRGAYRGLNVPGA